LDVILTELKRLKEGASAEELHRAKLDLKSRVVIQGEHSSVRASALSNDWWKLGRTRLLEEIKDEIDKVTHSELNEYLASIRMTPITLATLGPNGLELGDEIF
jgi:predicted Zn-dependent peptidase